MPQRSLAGLGFPRTRRLRRRREFLDVQGGRPPQGERPAAPGPRRRRAGRFVVFLRPRPDGALGRLGITTSAKIGRAVRRNRIRRLVREAFRTTPGLFPRDHDVVVLVTSGEGEWFLSGVIDELARWKQPRPLLPPAAHGGGR